MKLAVNALFGEDLLMEAVLTYGDGALSMAGPFQFSRGETLNQRKGKSMHFCFPPCFIVVVIAYEFACNMFSVANHDHFEALRYPLRLVRLKLCRVPELGLIQS